MPENHRPHPEQPQGPPGQPSWGPPPNPSAPATEPPRKSTAGKKALVGVLIALVVVAVVVAAAVFFFNSSRSTSGAARSTVVQTVTEFVDPPEGDPGQSEPEAEEPGRPTSPQLPAGAAAVSSEALNGAPAGSFRNVYTGSSVTSAPFAEAVAQAWRANYDSTGELTATVTAYSPVTGASYSMRCNDNGSYIACTGGNNAVVYVA